MATREAACHCGQLRLEVEGEPFAVSLCHCLACQRRTGSAFGMQAAFRPDQVQISGRYNDYVRISDQADRKAHAFHFCPDCGSQVFYTEPDEQDLIVVSVGSFADPTFPPPTESGYDSQRHPWIGLPDTIQPVAQELWDPARALYQAGEYAQAVRYYRRALALKERVRGPTHPETATTLNNLAMACAARGQRTEAAKLLRRALAIYEKRLGKRHPKTIAVRRNLASQER